MKPIAIIGIIIGASAIVSFGVVMAASYISQAIHPLKEVEKKATDEYNSIDISLRVSDIDIVPSSDGSTKATCYERDNYYHEVVVEDNTLKVRMVDKRSFIAKLFYPGMKLTLEVPQKEYVSFKEENGTGSLTTNKDLSFLDASITHSTGSIHFNSSISNQLDITASTGSIEVNNINAKIVKLKASTGSIHASEVKVDEMNAEVSTGNIDLNQENVNNLNLVSSTGNIKLNNIIINNHLKARASTGNVTLIDSDALSINIKTSTGNIKGILLTGKTFHTSTSTGHVNVPTGTTGGECYLETSTGNIDITIK